MKQLLTILLFFSFFISCSSDDDETSQGYTSFTVTVENQIKNTILGYYDKDGNCLKIDEYDSVKENPSKEYRIDNSVQAVYVFYDLYNAEDEYAMSVKKDTAFVLTKNSKNKFNLLKTTKSIMVDKSNIKQYPH